MFDDADGGDAAICRYKHGSRSLLASHFIRCGILNYMFFFLIIEFIRN